MRWPSIFIALSVGIGTLSAGDDPAAMELFEKRIRPSLLADCVECHGAEKVKGGLRLDSREALRKGGDSGPGVVPGKPEESLLLTAIKHLDPNMKMPSKAPKLSDDLIAAYERWIRLGAPDPRDHPPAAEAVAVVTWAHQFQERRKWWCFQPVVDAAPPTPKHASWSSHPVDRFLLAKMEERGLEPSSDADAFAVYRRLSYLLTGLPPRMTQAEAFAKAAAVDRRAAIESAVDRLLAEPAYGEAWARHWMDLVRYAESHGSEGDFEIPNAWRYRDYLIRALNDDVPVDQIIREHFAGDLLPSPRRNPEDGSNESAIGIAHLRLVEHGFQPVDTRDDQIKVMDSQIDVAMKAFQALTVSCARCHDHKFDAISQNDYYAMQGIFASCRPAMVTIDSEAQLQKNRTVLAALKKQIKDRVAAVWMAEAAKFPERASDAAEARDRAARLGAAVAAAQDRLHAFDSAIRLRLAGDRPRKMLPVSPLARWSFEKDASDVYGHLNGELLDGARVERGRLILDGKKAYMRTAVLTESLTAKTLEAWVVPGTLDQGGGGVITVEDRTGAVFDAVVFAEKQKRTWYAGSNNGRRSQSLQAPAETAGPAELVHLAIVWDANKRVSLYRNGEPYGSSYEHSDGRVAEFAAGQAKVLLGLRHTPAKANGFFAGEIEEARLYDRALEPAQIAASYAAGPNADRLSQAELEAAFTPAERAERARLQAALQAAEKERDAWADSAGQAWVAALDASRDDPVSPLRATKAGEKSAPGMAASVPPGVRMVRLADSVDWIHRGNGLAGGLRPAGDFTIGTTGERLISSLFPGGYLTKSLSARHAGVVQSPRFKIDTKFVSIHAAGRGGSQMRLICDNYPLGGNPGLYPRVEFDSDAPRWVKVDISYRLGTWAYLEFATRDDLTRIYDKKPKAGPSWFSVDAVAFHNDDIGLVERQMGTAGGGQADVQTLAARTLDAVEAWRSDKLNEEQLLLLNSLAQRNLLPTRPAAFPELGTLLANYARLEEEVPEPQRVPGVTEADSLDAPFLPRGDHLKPGATVPRGYLAALTEGTAATPARSKSGRLELAEALTQPKNPLTARVYVNRVWHWIFGRGLVGTPDNFGRMGEKPTHPELLDHLASRFAAPESMGGFAWSTKKLVRYLVTTRVFALSSERSEQAKELDAANELLTHSRVRRLEGEAIRDTLLVLAGQASSKLYGPPESAAARAADQTRRSVYVAVRRNSLSPFLTVFDSPKPFSTTGRRDETNVPAQSLTLLNDPFVIHCATAWAERLMQAEPGETGRVGQMLREAFGRPVGAEEERDAAAFVRELGAAASSHPPEAWRDLAHSLMNAKEFIYLR